MPTEETCYRKELYSCPTWLVSFSLVEKDVKGLVRQSENKDPLKQHTKKYVHSDQQGAPISAIEASSIKWGAFTRGSTVQLCFQTLTHLSILQLCKQQETEQGPIQEAKITV